MENYSIEKKSTPEEVEFQKEAKQIFDEIGQVLAKHPGWEVNPTLEVGPKGIFPNISLEKKPVSDIIVPEPQIIIPK
jgi:hypothetical protein